MKPNQKRVAKALEHLSPGQAAMQIAKCVRDIRLVRDNLRLAGAAQAADYAARALKSAEGALRHAERRARDAEMPFTRDEKKARG